MAYRSWITCSFPTHVIFRYHLPLSYAINKQIIVPNSISSHKVIYSLIQILNSFIYIKNSFIHSSSFHSISQFISFINWFIQIMNFIQFIHSFMHSLIQFKFGRKGKAPPWFWRRDNPPGVPQSGLRPQPAWSLPPPVIKSFIIPNRYRYLFQGISSETGFHYGAERNFVCLWRSPNWRSQVISLGLAENSCHERTKFSKNKIVINFF